MMVNAIRPNTYSICLRYNICDVYNYKSEFTLLKRAGLLYIKIKFIGFISN